jgi:hypothetical protein
MKKKCNHKFVKVECCTPISSGVYYFCTKCVHIKYKHNYVTQETLDRLGIKKTK